MNEMRDPKYPIRREDGRPHNKGTVKSEAKRMKVPVNQVCVMCLRLIHVQIYKNSGVCSENCRKDRDNDHEPFQPVGLRIHEGEET